MTRVVRSSITRSIKGRLIALHLIAVLAASVMLPLALYWRVDATARGLHERALREQAEQVAHYLRRFPNGSWSLDLPDAVRQLYSDGYERYGFAFFTKSGQVLFSTREHNEPLFGFDPGEERPTYFERNVGQSHYFGVSLPTSVDGEMVWVQISQDMAHRDVLIDDIVADFLTHVAWVIAPILTTLVCIDLAIFGRALQPLVEASALAQRIGPARPDVRLPEFAWLGEVAPLVRAVNEAFERLERGFIAQREFLADAAHELRTPLAILYAEAESLDDHEAARTLLADIESMTRIVNQLIDIAGLDSLTVKADDCADIQSVCSEVASFMAPIAVAQGKSIALSGVAEPVWVHGESGALFQAVRNLVENAIAHTAVATTVDITINSEGMLLVSDKGPGIPRDQRELIFQRFWRGDRNRAGNAGLGLAIVSRIVNAHGGRIDVCDAPVQGAMFSISLRLAIPPVVRPAA